MRQAGQLLFLRIPLLDPSPALAWLMPLVRPLLAFRVLLAWAALVVLAAVQVVLAGDAFLFEASQVLRPSNLPWLVAVYVVVKIVHEFAHGLTCRRFGGQVHEMGVMLLVFAPVPYCDATSSWQFASRWRRARPHRRLGALSRLDPFEKLGDQGLG